MATRWGIIGAGKISHDFVSAVHTLPEEEHKIIAVAARKLDDAQVFAKEHDIPLACNDYEALAKCKDIQVVYIGVVNNFHYVLGKLMLENGKNVLIEKPLCLTVSECKSLMALAKQNNLFLMEAVWSRFLPSYEYVMKQLNAGSAGSILNVSCSLGFPLTHVDNMRRLDLGGGALMNVGIYCVSAIAMVYNHEMPEKIVTVGHLNKEGVDDNISVALRYSGGRLASFTTSCLATLPCELHITGTKGTFKLPSLMNCPTEVMFNNEIVDFPLPTTQKACNYPNSAGLRYEAIEVRRCLLEGLTESPTMSHAHSLHLQYIMAEICRDLGVVFKGQETEESL